MHNINTIELTSEFNSTQLNKTLCIGKNQLKDAVPLRAATSIRDSKTMALIKTKITNNMT
jgi:hypothetical protein